MRGFLSAALLSCALLACGSNHNGASVCDNVVPPPAACMTACDPTPGAPNTCPGGYHCTPDGHCDAQCTPSGGECGDGFHCDTEGNCQEDGACEGIQCNITKCDTMSMPPTTITGTVFAPNGTLPLYGVQVYVPLHDVGPLPDGAVCSKCADTPLGDPLVSDVTKEDGTFTLTNVPDGTDIPLVVVSGKWRRIIKIPTIAPCTTVPLAATETTFPKSMTDMTATTVSVNMPKMAITTGNADALECLIRRMGVADSEITVGGGSGHVQLFHGNGASKIGNTSMPEAKTMWSSTDAMKAFDAVIFSCEGSQNPGNGKDKDAMAAVKAYADFGGRVFASHWHNVWIEGVENDNTNKPPAPWPSIANWNNSNDTFDGDDLIDEVNNPKGMSFATWMLNVVPGSTRDHIAIGNQTGKNTINSVDTTKAEIWTTWPGKMFMGTVVPQNFQFVTPAEGDPNNACGKVVFSDMHVGLGSTSSDPFPSGCSTQPLSPQEKALAFMLFDLSSCVGAIF
ncbi:MAG: hypothetical protein QM831_29690 [Kofleriaceae bacterium]